METYSSMETISSAETEQHEITLANASMGTTSPYTEEKAIKMQSTQEMPTGPYITEVTSLKGHIASAETSLSPTEMETTKIGVESFRGLSIGLSTNEAMETPTAVRSSTFVSMETPAKITAREILPMVPITELTGSTALAGPTKLHADLPNDVFTGFADMASSFAPTDLDLISASQDTTTILPNETNNVTPIDLPPRAGSARTGNARIGIVDDVIDLVPKEDIVEETPEPALAVQKKNDSREVQCSYTPKKGIKGKCASQG